MKKEELIYNLKQRLRRQRDSNFISEKLEKGAVYLLQNEIYLPDGYRIHEWDIFVNSTKSDDKGFALPNKMFVYREMSRIGFKWNSELSVWENKSKESE